jgi:hypothetical protein
MDSKKDQTIRSKTLLKFIFNKSTKHTSFFLLLREIYNRLTQYNKAVKKTLYHKKGNEQ